MRLSPTLSTHGTCRDHCIKVAMSCGHCDRLVRVVSLVFSGLELFRGRWRPFWETFQGALLVVFAFSKRQDPGSLLTKGLLEGGFVVLLVPMMTSEVGISLLVRGPLRARRGVPTGPFFSFVCFFSDPFSTKEPMRRCLQQSDPRVRVSYSESD